MSEIKRAAGYIRVSTAEQSTKGLSIETQIAEIKEYAKYHHMKLEDMYIDRGITARKSLDKRLEFMRMMEDVQSGKINHIIVLRLDRFFRNVYDYHRMMNEYLTPNKCDWSAVKEQYTTTTTNGRLMINLRLSIAEQECDTDSDRIKDVLAHRARQGYAISGAQPWGLKIVDHRVVLDKEKEHIVKDIFNQLENLGSVRGAMVYINNTHGTKFSYANFRGMITNTLYYGKYRDIENYCEAAITEEQFNRVQHLISLNVRKRGSKRIYIFSGLVRCNHCGRKMAGKYSTSSSGRVHYKYHTCVKANLDFQCDNKLSVSSPYMEQYLLENVKSLLEDHIKKIEIGEKESKVQKSNRKEIEKKLLRLNDLYVDGFIDMDKYKADYEELQSMIIDPPKEKKKDLTRLKEFLKLDLQTIYSTMSDTEKQSLWRQIIKEIRVSGREIVDVIFL